MSDLNTIGTKEKVKAVVSFLIEKRKMFTVFDVISILTETKSKFSISYAKSSVGELWRQGYMQGYLRENKNVSSVERKIYLWPYIYYPIGGDIGEYNPFWVKELKEEKKFSKFS